MSRNRSIQASVGVALLSLFGVATSAAFAEEKAAAREIEIVVENGYHPNKVQVKAGEPSKLKFVRKEYSGCTKEVVFPTLGIRRELPTNKPVVIDLPALEAGEVPFHCGMKMIKGTVQVEVAK